MAVVECEICSTINHVSPVTRNVKTCKYCASELPSPEPEETSKPFRLPQRTTDTF